jgi:4-hydroxybenzoate polyprenyltransferase
MVVFIMKSWFQLIRLPNLFTVPGDVIAGALLASASRQELVLLVPVLAASLALYCAGLVLNDFFDRDVDKIERPSRPIPSGKITSEQALVFFILLILSAMIFSYTASSIKLAPLRLGFLPFVRPHIMGITFLLTGFIFFYNSLAKQVPWLGVSVLGMCRGLNLFLGASITTKTVNYLTLAAGLILALYIIFVSRLARKETEAGPAGPKKIEGLIRGLIILQISFIAIAMKTGALPAAFYLAPILLLILFFTASKRFAKTFYGS